MGNRDSKLRYAWLVIPAALVALWATPATATAADCEFAWAGGDGTGWDSEESYGDFYDGAVIPIGPGIDYIETDLRPDAFDDYGRAEIDGNPYENPDTEGCTRDGRINRFPSDEPVTDLKVTPELFVPKDRPFGRQLVTIKNTGATVATFDLTFNGDLGSETTTAVGKTSSGDDTVSGGDRWASSCDDGEADGCASAGVVSRDPELAHNWEGKGPDVDSAEEVDLAVPGGNFDVTFEDVRIKPGKSESFMQIVHMVHTISEANTAAKQTEDGPGYLFAGLSEKERKRIQNW